MLEFTSLLLLDNFDVRKDKTEEGVVTHTKFLETQKSTM